MYVSLGVVNAQNITVINNYGANSDTLNKENYVLKSVTEHTYILNEYEPANTGVRSNLQQMIKYGLRSYIDNQIQVYEGRVEVNEDLDDIHVALNSIVSNAIWIHDLPFAQAFEGFSDATMRQLLALMKLDGEPISEGKSSLQSQKDGEVSLYVFQKMVFDLKVRMEREVNDFLNYYLPYHNQQKFNQTDSKILPQQDYVLDSWDHNTEDLLDIEPDFDFRPSKPKGNKVEDEQLILSQRIVELLESNNKILARHDERFEEMQRQIDDIKNEKSNDQNIYIENEIAELRELIMDMSNSGKANNSSLIGSKDAVTVIFEKNEHSLNLANQASLNSAVNRLRSDTSLNGVITGFADKTGDPEFNAWISKKRAEAVKNYLIAKGISAQRLEVNFLGDTESDYANPADRKVQVDFVPNEISKY